METPVINLLNLRTLTDKYLCPMPILTNAAYIPNLSCDFVGYVISLCINHHRLPWHGWDGGTPGAKGRTWWIM